MIGDSSWMRVERTETDDEGEESVVPRECDEEGCDGQVFAKNGEGVCGECNLLHWGSAMHDRHRTYTPARPDPSGSNPYPSRRCEPLHTTPRDDRARYRYSEAVILEGGFGWNPPED